MNITLDSDKITEAKITACMAKAISSTFVERFMPDKLDDILLSIRAAPETYTYLFAALEEMIIRVSEQLEAIEE